MFSFLTKEIPAPGFKISMPLSGDMDAERYICRLNIQDLNIWKYELTPKKRANQVNRVSQATGASDGKWTLTNSSFPLDEAMEPAECSPVDVPDSPASASSCDSPMYTLDEMRLFMPGEEDEISAETIAERMKANLILEGKWTPPPNRDYEGPLASCFHLMAAMEEREVIRRTVFVKAKQTLQSRLAEDAPKGWEHLHAIIYNGQRAPHGTRKFPEYHPNHRAYLLTREFKGGKYIVSAVRNLSACSQREIMKLLAGIEEKGREDMIYVANQGEDIPYCFGNEEPEFLNWKGSLQE
jgi:hypothetical protein